MGYPYKLAGAAIGVFLLGIVGIVLFGRIWYQIGLGAAIVIICGGLLFFAWRTDQKDKAARAGIDELPPV